VDQQVISPFPQSEFNSWKLHVIQYFVLLRHSVNLDELVFSCGRDEMY